MKNIRNYYHFAFSFDCLMKKIVQGQQSFQNQIIQNSLIYLRTILNLKYPIHLI